MAAADVRRQRKSPPALAGELVGKGRCLSACPRKRREGQRISGSAENEGAFAIAWHGLSAMEDGCAAVLVKRIRGLDFEQESPTATLTSDGSA